MKTREEAFDMLECALSAARASGCDAADAVLMSGRRALTRFANNGIHQNVSREGASLTVRAARGRRIGCVRTESLTRDGLIAAGKKAAEIAASAAEDKEFPGIAASPAAEPCGLYDEATAEATPEERAKAVREIIGRIERSGASASGSLATVGFSMAVANTAGTRQYDRATVAELNVVAMADVAAGCAELTAARLAEVDTVANAETALRKCLDSRGAADFAPGEYTVVLEPSPVAEMFQFLVYLGFGSQRMQEGQSCLQGKVGARVCDERISAVDDPRDPAGLPFAFDGEGVATRRVELISRGVFRGVVYDRRTAAKDKVESTGHGFAPPNPRGGFPQHVIVSAGDVSIEDMITSTERGLLVSYFHYTNVAEPSTATLTGMTRYGLFEIVDGRVKRPVKNLRFTQSVLGALNQVAAVGATRTRFGTTVVPAMKINRFRFTGASDH